MENQILRPESSKIIVISQMEIRNWLNTLNTKELACFEAYLAYDFLNLSARSG